ncbi:hypothetical protein Dvina_34590 [Dactylosporangium vinaceum]|uniref:Uncharacterized protein n=1 Tax=Dactylosporangium vinaceum TaxID=53362 RepID=A0ABV5MM29_9ACTN|nr:hypothetical protein [Dactylosporangium vinaceum]UAB93364.1 hypothetical protein Dvina_34590 [Dactylosporangium vinaceum]
MAGETGSGSGGVTIIESAPRARFGRRRVVVAAVVVVVLGVVAGVVAWSVRGSGSSKPAAAPGPRASQLYAADGTTLIARFDDADPRESCLRTAVNDWGFFCDYVVSWWKTQAAFGGDEGERLDRLRHGGYRIVGSLDVQQQAAAKQRVDQVRPVGAPQVFTLAAVEPGTGLIRTMAVNRNFRRPAAASPSQAADGSGRPLPAAAGPDAVDALVAGDANAPGDAAGPAFMMFTLAAALESGVRLDHAIDTKKVYQSRFVIDPQSPAACSGQHFWCPANTGETAFLSGRRTMWDAFGHGVVTYFVPLEEQVGVDKAVAMAKRLGIVLHGQVDQALSQQPAMWGAFTLGVSATSALDLANAYATLAADGIHCAPLPVAQLVDGAGRPVPDAGPACASVLSADVARAAVDAGRCPVGDRSAVGDGCGAAPPLSRSVRADVGRPVFGQAGLTTTRRAFSAVVGGPQLVTAGLLASVPGADDSAAPLDGGAPGTALAAVTAAEHDGLAPLPQRDFTAPPRELTAGS